MKRDPAGAFRIAACLVLILACGVRASDVAEPGVLEGHLTIVSPKTVEPDQASPSKGGAADYRAYPLLVLSRDGKTVIKEVSADKDGNYRVPLPPGDYLLDAKGRAAKRVRAKPKPFAILSNQRVRVDFELDTGIR